MMEYIYTLKDIYPTMSFMTKSIIWLLIMSIVIGIASAEVTFTVDQPEFVRPGPSEWQNFTISVCGANQPYQISMSPAPKDWDAKFPYPELVSSNVKYTEDHRNYFVSSPNGSCNLFEFNTWEGTTSASYWYRLSIKDGRSYNQVNKLNITILDPEAVLSAEFSAKEADKIAALEEKVTSQQRIISELQSNITKEGVTSPSVIPTATETHVQTIGELAGITPTPTLTSEPHPTINETRIAELEAKVEAQKQQIEEQRSLIDDILSWLWGE